MSKIFLLNPPDKKGKIKKFKLEKLNKTRKTKNKKFKKFKSVRFCNPVKKEKITKVTKIKKIKKRVIKHKKPKVIDMTLQNGTYVKKGVAKMKRKSVKKVKSVKVSKIKVKSHRISVNKVKGGYKVKRKSRLAKRFAKKGMLINPMNTKSIINTVKEAGLLTIGMLGSNILPAYALPEKFRTGYLKPVTQVGTGVVLFIIAKKFLKNEPIAKALLLGSVVGAMKEVADTYVMPKLLPASTTATSTTAGLRIPAKTIQGLKLPASNERAMVNTGVALSATRNSRR